MRRRAALLVLGCTLLACGGNVSSETTADGGGGGGSADASADATGDGTGTTMEAGAQDAAMESPVPLDGGADAADGSDGAVFCGYVDGGSTICVPCPVSMPSAGQCDFNGVTCSYPGSDCTCTSGCTEGQCCPVSCAQLGFPCGPSGDGCGGVLHCRDCPAGQTCGANGACVAPGDTGCVPSGCSGHVCGVVDDGCGGKIDCGECIWSCVLSGP